MNLPNYITLTRIAAVPLLIWLLLTRGHFQAFHGERELAASLVFIAASEGFTIEASDFGKVKMVAQIVSVVAAIVEHHWLYWDLRYFVLDIRLVAHMAIWFMVALSLGSAVDYFVGFWSKIDRTVMVRQRRRRFILRRRKRDVPAT